MADEITGESITPQQEVAQEQAEEAIEDVKEEVDKRDDAILSELRNIHQSLLQHNEHMVRHLENHTTASASPVQEVAHTASEDAVHPEEHTEPVKLSIDEPKDMQTKEKKAEKTRKKAHGRRR